MIKKNKQPQLSWKEVDKICYLSEKFGHKSKKLMFKLARQIGITQLEHSIDLVLEDPSIKKPIPYLIKICKNIQESE